MRILIILLFLNYFSINAQQWVDMMKNPNTNFYETQAAFNAYWANKTVQKGKGYNAFKRWEYFMAPRVYPTGNITAPSQTYKNYRTWEQARLNAGIPKSTDGTWTIVGPTGKPSISLVPYSVATPEASTGRVYLVACDAPSL